MSDRLDQLRRQRALLQEHLVWLDAEIRAAATANAPAETAAPLRSSPADAGLDLLVAAQQAEPAKSAAAVKRGCFVAFALAFGVLALGVYGLYLYSRSRH